MRAEAGQRRNRLRGDGVPLGARGRQPQHVHQGSLALVGILGRALAHRHLVGLPIEHVVGDLESGAERLAVGRQGAPLVGRRLTENGAGLDGEGEQRTGLHGLQGADAGLTGRGIAVASLCREVEDLPANHPAEACGARQSTHELKMGLHVIGRMRCRGEFKCQCQQGVTRENGGRFVEGDMHGRAAAPEVVIIHGGQVVMDQRIAVQHFHRAGCVHCMVHVTSEKPGGLDDKERAQPFAAAKHGMSHRGEQPFGASDLTVARLRGEKAGESILHGRSDLRQAIRECDVAVLLQALLPCVSCFRMAVLRMPDGILQPPTSVQSVFPQPVWAKLR
ncbi:hypothetical protein CHELA1G11_14123 [Hyphomicrobiales bacterium]|nr:hypothetical protein CHELA1G11_14123 [Hyphomicrobiales bacterium]